MNKKQTPRYIIIALVLAVAISLIWPTIRYQFLSPEAKEQMREIGTLNDLEAKIIKQGLDLKGGIYIVLEVDVPTLMTNLTVTRDQKFDALMERVRSQMRQNQEADFFTLFEQEVTASKLRLARYYDVDYGANVEAIITRLKDEANDAIDRVLEILQNRVDQFGVSEPTIQKQGNQRIIVELAGIQDPERARALLQSTALLEFGLVKNPDVTNELLLRIDKILTANKAVEELIPGTSQSPEDTAVTKLDTKASVSEDKTISISELFSGETQVTGDTTDTSVVVDQKLFKERPFSSLLRALRNDIGVPEKNLYAVKKILNLPEVQAQINANNGRFLFSNKPEVLTTPSGTQENLYRLYYLEREPALTGGVIEKANATIGGQGGSVTGQPIVLLSMNSEGSRKWSMVTGGNVGRRIAIILDKKVHMAPVIREKITQGGTQIEGFANMEEAKDIAIVLRAGALPAPVKIIEERIVGPSLGADSIRKGTLSVVIGLLVVLVFMVIYYKLSGVIADLALIWNLVLVMAILAMLGATLTLPGIAALILTAGMSIDSNVIIFERIREELNKGKTPHSAVESGYSRALTTIIDANFTTLVAALVLYQFGTGPIRGFATVLFWGIVISMFTAVFVTRTIFNTLTERRKLRTLSI